MENNKNKKFVKFQGDMLNFCDFIQVFVFTRNHHLKVLALSDNYRSIKADLYNIEERNQGPCRSKRLIFLLQSDLGYEYETNMFSS